MKSKLFCLALGALLALFNSSCGQNPGRPALQVTPSSTACASGTVQILVGDGFLNRLCGCSEPNETYFFPGQPLSCTTAGPVTVFFHLVGTRQEHQIFSTGSLSFAASPISSPKRRVYPTHGVSLSSSGTYAFRDQFYNGLSGTITVP